MIVAALFIVTDELFGVFRRTADLVLNEAYESLGVGTMLELKVEALAVRFFSNVGTFLLSVIL